MTTGDGRLRYLSVLSFEDEWLDRLRAGARDVEVLQVPATEFGDIPVDLRTVDVLHTSVLLPDPDSMPALRWVQLDTSGVDHVRDTALWRSDVALTTIGGVSPAPLAEYVLFMILGFAHRLPAMLDFRSSREWPTPTRRWDCFLPASLAGVTVGVVGYGRVGREIGRLVAGHGMRVIAVNRSGRLGCGAERAARYHGEGEHDEHEVELVPVSRLEDVVARCDYLVVVCPLTVETRGLVGADTIAAMKPGSVLVNVARGGIVDETALLAAVRSGQLDGAAMDVFDEEPLAPDSPWWDEPNVVVTPHVAGLAPLYADNVLEIVTSNLKRLSAGETLLNVVDRERGY